MKYCSLQHRTLLQSPVTSTTGCCFCFGSVSSFFLELLLHCSPVAYWHLLTWGVHLSVSYSFCLFILFMGSQGKNTEVAFHFLPHSVPPTLQQATADQHFIWRHLDIHGKSGSVLFWGHGSVLLGPDAHKFCLCPPRVCFPSPV